MGKILKAFVSVVVFVSLIIVIIHYEDFDNEDFDISSLSFTKVLVKIKDFDEETELGRKYMAKIRSNIINIKSYINAEYFDSAYSDLMPNTVIGSQLDIQNTDNFLDKMRLALSNGYSLIKSWFADNFGGNADTKNAFDVVNSYVLGFLPLVANAVELQFNLTIVSLNYIVLFIDVII